MSTEAQQIDPNDYVSEKRQTELIMAAQQGMIATAIRQAIRETVSALQAQGQTDVAMVPREPTPEMLQAVWGSGVDWSGLFDTADDKHVADIYRRMIAAAPTAVQREAGDE